MAAHPKTGGSRGRMVRAKRDGLCRLTRPCDFTAQITFVNLPSQIVAGIGEVEAFVNQREIRHHIAASGVAEDRPVQKRRITHIHAADRALRIGRHQVHDIPTPALDNADRECIRRKMI